MPLRTLLIGDLHYHDKNLHDHELLAKAIHNAIDEFAIRCPREVSMMPDGVSDPSVAAMTSVAALETRPLDLIVCMGDEFEDDDPLPNVRGACVKFLRSLRLRTVNMIILVGNHTRKNSRVSIGPDHTLADLRSPGENGLWMVEDPTVISIPVPGTSEVVDFAALPYIDPPVFDEIIDTYCPRLANYDPSTPLAFVLGHQEIHGSQTMPGQVSKCVAKWRDSWPPLISGHLHQRHVVGNGLWIGTPMQHSLNESTDKYVYFGFLGHGKSTLRSWTRLPGNMINDIPSPYYENVCGRLYEYPMTNIPIRAKLDLNISDCPAVLLYVRQHPINHYTLVITYNDASEVLSSQAYNELKIEPSVTRITMSKIERSVTRPSETETASGSRQMEEFVKHLQRSISTSGLSNLASDLLSKVGNWSI